MAERIPSVQEVAMANHDELLAAISDLRDAVQAIEVSPQVTVEATTIPAPQVSVAPAVVNVEQQVIPAPIVNIPPVVFPDPPEPVDLTPVVSKLSNILLELQTRSADPEVSKYQNETKKALQGILEAIKTLSEKEQPPIVVKGGGGVSGFIFNRGSDQINPATEETLALANANLDQFTFTGGDLNVVSTPSGTGDVNIKQVNGQTVNVGTGTAGTGTARVAVASDSALAVNNGAGASAVNIQDGGNSITVDGTFFQATQPVSAASLPLPSGAATAALQTQPGVDIGDVTINNASGGSAVNIQDGGNSLTVDYATTGSGTSTGALRVELPTNGTGVIATVSAVTAITNALPAGTNTIGNAIPDRPSQGSGRTYKTATLSAQTADATLYTVTNGKTLYVTTLKVAAFNTSTSANGILLITDGNGGTTRLPLLMTPAGVAAQLAASAAISNVFMFQEPLQFTSAIYCDITLGTVTFSAMMVGYEQ